MATGWNPSQVTCYLEEPSDGWLTIYKDPQNTKWIKSTSIAFPVSPEDFWIELTPRPISSPTLWATPSSGARSVWEGMSAPGAQLLKSCKENHVRIAMSKNPFLPAPQPYIKPEKLPSQDCRGVQCSQRIKLPECIYPLKRKYSLYVSNRGDYLLWLTLKET